MNQYNNTQVASFRDPRFLGHITFEYIEVVFCEAIACI